MEAVAADSPPAQAARSNSSSPLASKAATPSPDPPFEHSVSVAVRARPLVARERLEGAKACLFVSHAAGSVQLGNYRQFKYDHAFGPEAQQQDVYAGCVSGLVDAVLQGYNTTVLAYGPTGSGKTYTMGMGSPLHSITEHYGIIPRAIRELFRIIEAAPDSSTFVVKAQFLEIYNEELRDLLASVIHKSAASGVNNSPGVTATAGNCSPTRSIAIRECPDGQILVTGAREVQAASAEELLKLLDAGTLARATSGTLLNEQSSRSHAIFTIIVEHSISSVHNPTSSTACLDPSATAVPVGSSSSEFEDSSRQRVNHGADACDSALHCGTDCSGVVERRCAKMHLVDLAGSERLSRSGAAGARLREAVNINQGLLALGNVISALSDTERRPGRHIPYRDSKLTRLLQDSLGGNSRTLMIACVSSADDAVEESLNTLKYAARARSIKNKPVLNRQCLYDNLKSVATEIQAQQLLLLRRFVQQLLGPSYQAVLPDLLLKDAAEAGDNTTCDRFSGSSGSLKMLQQLQAMAASTEEQLQRPADASQSSDQEDRPAAHGIVARQLIELEAKLTSATNHITRLDLQLDVCTAEQQALEQAAGMLQEQQTEAWEGLLQQVEQLHGNKQLTDTARQVLEGYVRQQQQQRGLTQLAELIQSGSVPCRRISVHSYPLPEAQTSSSEAAGDRDTAQNQPAGVQHTTGVAGSQETGQLHQVRELRKELAEKTALLEAVKGDLSKDEHIFADKVKQVAGLQAELAAAVEREEAMAASMLQMQADIRRWRVRALAVQRQRQQQEEPVLPAPPQSPSTVPPHSPCSQPVQPGPQQEPSSAALQDAPQCPQPAVPPSCATPKAAPTPVATQQKGASVCLPPLELNSSMELHLDPVQVQGCEGVTAAAEDDQVLYDAELASYISETDYTELQCADVEADSHLLAELQVVLSDKAALEEEKAAAQAEAAAAQRAFEHSRAMLEAELNHCAGAIRSQEALIATLQANEAEAKSMGALYLERCRELEAELADLSLDLQELTSALAKVEANAAATAEEKQKLRCEYEGKIEATVKQMATLQEQMKQQDAARLDKERQRAAGRIQQLKLELSTMKAQQESLRKRLQDRLAAQERDAAIKSRELASLRRAAECARKRVAELEEENKRQRAALKARINEAATARRQLRDIGSRVSPLRSRPCESPKMSPGNLSAKAAPVATSPGTSRATPSPRTYSRTSPRAQTGCCGNVSPNQKLGYAVNHARLSGLPSQHSVPSSPRPHTACQGSAQHQGKPAAACPAVVQGALSTSTSSSSSSSSSSTTNSDSRQLLTKEVQLLVSEYIAKHRLRQLQAKQAAVLSRRDELLSAKAQIQLKQLRRAHPDQADTGTINSIGSPHSSGEEHCTQDPTEQILLEDYSDQLDAVGAQLQHIQQLMQKAAAEAAAASAAAGHLLASTSDMSRVQLQELLGLAFKELALQAAECQETVNQVKRLQVELAEAQQELQETSCCLQMAQLQHQTQLAELQREHEHRSMAFLRQRTASASETEVPALAAAAAVPCVQPVITGLLATAACAGQTVSSGASAGTGPNGGQQHGSRLMDLLSLLAQQGNQEQRQKLLGALNRLHQLQHMQQDQPPLQQQQQQQQQGEQPLHWGQTSRPQAQIQHAPGQLEQVTPSQGHMQEQLQHHLEQSLQQSSRTQHLCQVQQLQTKQTDQLQRLKLCRAQQQLEQHRARQCDVTQCLQFGAGQIQQQQCWPLQHQGLLQQQQQQLPEQQQQQQLQEQCMAGSTDDAKHPCSAQTPQQKQQAGLHQATQHQQRSGHVAIADSADDGESDSSSNSSNSDLEENVRGSSKGSTAVQHNKGRCAVPELKRSMSAAAVGSLGHCSGLRASASRLQAKLCSYRGHSQPARLRQSSPAPGSLGARRSTEALEVNQSSSFASPRCSLQGNAGLRQPLACEYRSLSPVVGAEAVHESTGLDASPTAAMLRKAAQLAMRSSLDAARWSSSQPARLAHQPATRLSAAGAFFVHAPPELPGRSSDSAGNSSTSHLCGSEEFGNSRLQVHGMHRCSSSNSPGLTDTAIVPSAAALGSTRQPNNRHHLTHSSTERSRPASLDVCSSTDCMEQLSTWDAKHKRHAASPVNSSAEVDAPSAADWSPRKDTCKGALQCRKLSLEATTTAAAAENSYDTCGSPKSGRAHPPKSPYQQFKASAAAAAATGKDQQLLSPGLSGSRSRAGVTLTSPSSYVQRLQSLNGPLQ